VEESLLCAKAAEIRRRSLEMALKAGKGHVPPAFSWTEIAVSLYYGGILRYDARQPRWADRDRFILSKGHACLTLYAILADKGFFPKEELERFAAPGALLPGHPDIAIPGVEAVSGSLGHGLGVGAGMALGARLDGRGWRTFVVLGDGECDEGSVWEAAMFASHRKLDNLVAVIDRNRLSATDFTENVLALEPLDERWRAFGWDVLSIDGHSFPQLLAAFSSASKSGEKKPRMIIANTVKGKGVEFMQNSPDWHHRLPKGDAVPAALAELGKAK
jgi:transketolase